MFHVLNYGLLTKHTTCLHQVVYIQLPQGSTNIFHIDFGHGIVDLRVLMSRYRTQGVLQEHSKYLKDELIKSIKKRIVILYTQNKSFLVSCNQKSEKHSFWKQKICWYYPYNFTVWSLKPSSSWSPNGIKYLLFNYISNYFW